MHGLGLPLQEVAEIDSEDIRGANPRAGRNERRKRLEMRIVLVRGEEYEFSNTGRFPCVEDIVQQSMQGLFAQRCVSRETPFSDDIDAILDGGCHEDPELGRQIARQSLDDDRVRAERQMRPVLLARADWDDQPWIAIDGRRNLLRT